MSEEGWTLLEALVTVCLASLVLGWSLGDQHRALRLATKVDGVLRLLETPLTACRPAAGGFTIECTRNNRAFTLVRGAP